MYECSCNNVIAIVCFLQMNDGALYYAPSPVQESIVACSGKVSKCICDSCGASRREKGRLQKQKSRARKKLELQNDINDRGKCQTLGACNCIQHAVENQNAINALKMAEHRADVKFQHDDHLASFGKCEAVEPSLCGCPQHLYINAVEIASRKQAEYRSELREARDAHIATFGACHNNASFNFQLHLCF